MCGHRRPLWTTSPRRAVRLRACPGGRHRTPAAAPDRAPAAAPRARRPRGLQVGGTDSADGLRVTPGPEDLPVLLRALDGRRTQRAVLTDAARAGHDPAAVSTLLDGLR